MIIRFRSHTKIIRHNSQAHARTILNSRLTCRTHGTICGAPSHAPLTNDSHPTDTQASCDGTPNAIGIAARTPARLPTAHAPNPTMRPRNMIVYHNMPCSTRTSTRTRKRTSDKQQSKPSPNMFTQAPRNARHIALPRLLNLIPGTPPRLRSSRRATPRSTPWRGRKCPRGRRP